MAKDIYVYCHTPRTFLGLPCVILMTWVTTDRTWYSIWGRIRYAFCTCGHPPFVSLYDRLCCMAE